MPSIIFTVLIIFFTTFNMQCGGDSSSSSSSSTTSTNELAASSFPTGMVVSSLFSSASGDPDSNLSASLNQVDVNEDESNVNGLPYEEKLAILNNVINGTSLDDCFDYDADLTAQLEEATCYGPQVTLSGTHPDGTIQGGSQALPQGDLGIWSENEDDTGEACFSAKMNEEVGAVEQKIDFALFAMASTFCVANVSGQDLPEAGESINLSTVFTEAATDADFTGFDPSSVQLSRLDDTAQGDPIYNLNITGMVLGSNESSNEDDVTFNMEMTHTPLDSTNSTYEGRLNFKIVMDENNIPTWNCREAGEGTQHTLGASVVYQKTSETDIRVRYRQGVFCGLATEDDIFMATTGEVDHGHRLGGCSDDSNATATSSNGWGDDFQSLVANVDPSTGYGHMVYSWQAGRCDAQTRVLKASTSADGGENSNEGGCGYFGFGPDMTTSQTELDGMICNWTAPGSENFGSKTILNLVQRQCVSRENSSDVFSSVSSTLNISYAPTLDCNSDGALLCDGESCETTHDLLNISSMIFTDPTDPDNYTENL